MKGLGTRRVPCIGVGGTDGVAHLGLKAECDLERVAVKSCAAYNKLH